MSQGLVIQTRKEIRALLPWTICVATATVALALVGGRNLGIRNVRAEQAIFLMAHPIGVLAVAALSIGHELTHGTLANLLVQPIDRSRILRLKLVVLTIALAGLGLVGSGPMQSHSGLERGEIALRLMVWGPVVAGIGLVPLLTLLTRRPLGGVVFGLTIPGLLMVIEQQLEPLHLGLQPLAITWYGTLVASALGFATFLWQFRRLEVAGDGRERVSALSAAVTRDVPLADYRPTVRHSWVWLLVKKELRLQQMTLAVSGLYTAGAGAVMVMQHRDLAHYVGPTFSALSMLHAMFIPVIAGAMSSAEERHLGTLASQVLQPRNMRLQWAIKVAVTMGLALALAFGLPMLLMGVHKPVEIFRVEPDFMVGVALLCAGAMYVSSFSSNTLWAILACFPIFGIATLIGGWGRRLLASSLYWMWEPRHHQEFFRVEWFKDKAMREAILHPVLAASRDIQFSLAVIEISLIVGFGFLILYFAARNHRMLGRRTTTVGWQLGILTLFAGIGTMAHLVILEWAYRLLPF